MTSSKYHKILRSCKKSCTYSFYHAIEFGVFSQLLKSILPLAVFLSFTVLSAQVSAEDSAKKVLKITLPPIPEFKVPSPYPDNSHTVLEMKRRGGRFLNQSVQITGYIIWKYDCITELTKQGMTKRAAKKIIAKKPQTCQRPNFYLGDKLDTPRSKGLRVVDVPRKLRRDETRGMSRKERRAHKPAPKHNVGDRVTVTGTWLTSSPSGFIDSLGLLLYQDLAKARM